VSGNLWLFGGSGYGNDVTTFFEPLNDLWKYNPSTNQWTWMSGDNTSNGFAEYGTQGIPSPANTPNGRYGSVSWKDASGNLWLFGGDFNDFSVGYFVIFNHLWKYDPVTNQWTWMKGNMFNNYGVYGTQNIPAGTNVPGARNSSISWTDAFGNLWLFGGSGYAASTNGGLNDLW